MKHSRPLILLLLLVLVSTSLPQTQSDSDDLIQQICKKTPFYELCLQSLQSSSPNSTADVKGLAATMANLVLSNTTQTLDYIQELVKQNNDPQMERPLAYCAELYIPVVKYNLPQAINALSRGRYGFAKYVLSDTGKQADTCEKGFSGSNDSPLTAMNKTVRNLCDVGVAILNLLLKV